MTFGLEDKPLELFSTPHIAAIVLTLVFCAVLVLYRKMLQNETAGHCFSIILAVIISAQQILLYIWYAYSGEWSLSWTLPLQLCDVSIFLSVLVLTTKNKYLSELLYFWGLGGATQAILTPDLGTHTFPHFVFYQFFLGHGLIVLTCLFIILVNRFRPTFKSVIRTFVITNLYAAVIIPVNALTGGNYLFLRSKPQSGSIMELLGPWPWYILSLEAVAAVIFLLLYLPFAFSGAGGKSASISA
ncbi:MAG: TIGR02206 family membrane protein [Ruminiclostridium sp.]|nr:TIGR02206 family membrane protein [Ruminiclostridium sp.]